MAGIDGDAVATRGAGVGVQATTHFTHTVVDVNNARRRITRRLANLESNESTSFLLPLIERKKHTRLHAETSGRFANAMKLFGD